MMMENSKNKSEEIFNEKVQIQQQKEYSIKILQAQTCLQKGLAQLSQIRKQNLINKLKQNHLKKAQNLMNKLKNSTHKQALRILGGGQCCSQDNSTLREIHQYNIQEKIRDLNLPQALQPQDNNQNSQQTNINIINELPSIFPKNAFSQSHVTQVIEKFDQASEVKEIFQKYLNHKKVEILMGIDFYRNSLVEAFNIILLYFVSGTQELDKDDRNGLIKYLEVFLNHLKDNSKLFSCQDLEFAFSFLSDFNEEDFKDAQNQNQIAEFSQFVQKLLTGKLDNSQENQLLNNIEQVAFSKQQQLQCVWQIVDKVHEKIKSFSKDNVFYLFVALIAQKHKKFGKIQNIQASEELLFYIEKFVEYSNKETSSYIILYILIQINSILSNTKAQINQDVQNQYLNNQIVLQFIQMLKQQSTQKHQSENFLLFFKFTVKDATFRYLSNSILLKYFSILKTKQNSDAENLWVHLVYCYATEKNEAVKLAFQNNTAFVERVNQEVQKNPTKIGNEVIQYQQDRKQEMQNNKISKDEIEQIEDTIKDPSDFLQKISIKLIEQWELEARKRLEKDIAQKDDILLEVQDLYIDQNIKYLQGNNIFNDQQDQKQKQNALQQIINNFLLKSSKGQQCNTLAVLAEGGTGKSMLIKKLETVIMKEKNSNALKYNSEVNFIPLLIKCNSLDANNPSLDNYLLNQKLSLDQIQKLKTLPINKLILLDGYDEYAGDFFKVHTQFKLNEWKNTLLIVSSRMEKINENDAEKYFSNYNQQNQIEKQSLCIVKLEEFEKKDIFQYCEKFYNKEATKSQIQLSQEQFVNVVKESLENKDMANILYLPINLYLFTRMAINKSPNEIKELIKDISDQIQIQEIFFKEQFNREALDFMTQTQEDLSNKSSKEQIINQFFIYFQTVAMEMFRNKGEKSNFLQIKREEIKFNLIGQIVKTLSVDNQKKLKDKIENYVNSKIITRVKDEANQVIQSTQQKIIEFKHKSLFEYFVARAMKFDFDINRENICNLSLEELSKFNINTKLIMTQAKNQSEQQILIKFYKLLQQEILSDSFYESYKIEDIKKTNRFIQYIKKSTIPSPDKKSQIDIGASNLLSALFISKFSYQGLKFELCSFSCAYLLFNQRKQVSFVKCNLSHAYLETDSQEMFQGSNLKSAMFKSYSLTLDTSTLTPLYKSAFSGDNLISISNSGYINCISLKDNMVQVINTKKVLQNGEFCEQIEIINEKKIAFCISKTLYEIDAQTLDVITKHEFSKKITTFTFSRNNSKYLISLQNSKSKLYGTIQDGFKDVYAEGYNPFLTDKLIILYNGSIQFLDIEKNFSVIKTAQTPQIKNALITKSGLNAVFCFARELQVWDLKSLTMTKQIKKEHFLKYAAISQDDQILALAFLNEQNEGEYIELIHNNNNYQRIAIYPINKQYEKLSFSLNGNFICLSQKEHLEIINKENDKDYKKMFALDQKAEIKCVSFSPNGRYLVTGNEDQNIKIWDVQLGYKLINIVQISDEVISIAFSPDSKTLLVACKQNQRAYLWNVEKGFQFIKEIMLESQQIETANFSSDGKYLAFAFANNTFQIRNVLSDYQIIKEINEYKQEQSNQKLYVMEMESKSQPQLPAVFSIDSKCLAIVTNKKICRLLDVQKNFQSFKSIEGHTDQITSIAYSKNGKYMATSSKDTTCKIWNVQKDYELITTIKDHTSSILSISFSADSKYLATGSFDPACKIWNAEQGFTLENILKIKTSKVAFSPTENHLATNKLLEQNEHTLQVWNISVGYEIIKQLQGHTQQISSLALSYDDKLIATASQDCTCKIWDAKKGFELIHTGIVHQKGIRQVIFSIDNKLLLTSCENYVKVWNKEKNFELLTSIKLEQSLKLEQNVALSHEYLVITNIGEMQFYNVNKGFKLEFKKSASSFIKKLYFSRDGKYLASLYLGEQYEVYDASNKFEQVTVLQYQFNSSEKSIQNLAFSIDSQHIAYSNQKNVSIYQYQDTCQFENIDNFECEDNVFSLEFLNNNEYLVMIIPSQDLKIYHLNNKYLHTIKLADTNIQNYLEGEYNIQIIFTKDQKYMLLGYQDTIFRVYQVERQKGVLNQVIEQAFKIQQENYYDQFGILIESEAYKNQKQSNDIFFEVFYV
ncbi:WD domain, G-beta repeat protein (macronuclear) [Tetrahymena thermophila SB210]|uniref:WD domain, G-beta repeat protein n=1 Tax=Tetrahymena thermophila (strain SB210) TaxID=312017 RepID=I7LZQ6_TETTS|nr:WD domain, G-beta repeat protein [Tetrahymena thermophila SB210]EAR84625.2 WD domain, G-beta repeat protein [Tetrahymena thermophila SB210]|eukprot:XP_001032288.2 WD domain, G-beta repeat protein [Tetrahymena thermophila SB210]